MGLLNGFLHVKLKTPSFMTTLGMGFAGVGVATAILGGDTVRISDQTFRFLSLGRVLGIPDGGMDCRRSPSRLPMSSRNAPARPLALCHRHR